MVLFNRNDYAQNGVSAVKKLAKLRIVILRGGPWSGSKLQTRIPYGETTLTFRVGKFVGRYAITQREGVWETLV